WETGGHSLSLLAWGQLGSNPGKLQTKVGPLFRNTHLKPQLSLPPWLSLRLLLSACVCAVCVCACVCVCVCMCERVWGRIDGDNHNSSHLLSSRVCVCVCVCVCVRACPSSGVAAVCLSAALALCALGVSGCTEPHGDEEACRVRRHMKNTDEHMNNTECVCVCV